MLVQTSPQMLTQTSHQTLVQTSPYILLSVGANLSLNAGANLSLNTGANCPSKSLRGLKPKDGDSPAGFKAGEGMDCPAHPTPPDPMRKEIPGVENSCCSGGTRAAHGCVAPGPSPTTRCHTVGAVLPLGQLPRRVPSPRASAQCHSSWGRGQHHSVLGGSSGSYVMFCSRSEHQPPFTQVALPSARRPVNLVLPALPHSGCPCCPMKTPGGGNRGPCLRGACTLYWDAWPLHKAVKPPQKLLLAGKIGFAPQGEG